MTEENKTQNKPLADCKEILPAKAAQKARAMIQKYINKLESTSDDPTSRKFLCDRLSKFLPAILFKLYETDCPPEEELEVLLWTSDKLTASLQREVLDYIFDLSDRSAKIYGDSYEEERTSRLTKDFLKKLAGFLCEYESGDPTPLYQKMGEMAKGEAGSGSVSDEDEAQSKDPMEED